MIYPEYLKENSIVGICAPSSGVGHKIESFDASLKVLRQEGWKIWETEHVRVDDIRGGDAIERARELMSLYSLPSVNAVFCAAGGDFLSEILPYIDWQLLKDNPKWLMGSSDPTGLLFPLTTLCDVATLYGANGGSFDTTVLPEDPSDDDHPSGVTPQYLKNTLAFLRGENPVQESYPKYIGKDIFSLGDDPLVFNEPSRCTGSSDSIHVTGRCIGGCIDVLKDLIGTRFDGAQEFIRRYEDDGVIWYFDNFALSSAVLYRTFLQMRYAGWISPDTTKAILIGRTLFENEEADMSYEDAVRLAFPDIPYIREADIGHTVPHFTMINGAMLKLDWEDSHAQLRFFPE